MSSDDTSPQSRRWGKPVLFSSLAVFVVLAVTAALLIGHYYNRVQTTFAENRNVIEGLDDLEDDSAYRSEEGTVNFLLLGSDSRGESEDEYRSSLNEAGARSDVMMFVHIPADRSGVYVMSIMRDLWVDIPGHGEGRINSALSLGGLGLTVETVENLLDTHIDHVATIDFEGFSALTTALGGVYIDNPRAFSAGQRNPSFYPEGDIRLEGDDALRFVRERKAFALGDYVRVENQQLVLEGIVDRFLSADTLSSPDRIIDVIESFLPFMEFDSGLDMETLVGYGLDLRNISGSDIESFTLPGGEPAVTSIGAQVILPQEEALDRLQEALRNQEMDSYLDYVEDLESGDMATPSIPEDQEDLAPGQEESLDPGASVNGSGPVDSGDGTL